MGKRKTGRKLAMQALYQATIQKVDVAEIIDEFIDPKKYSDETREWATELATKTWGVLTEVDGLIEKYAIDWDLSRITPIDRNLLRMGLYELKYTDTVPSIIINEIIEISKRYSTDQSAKFINGILGNFVKE